MGARFRRGDAAPDPFDLQPREAAGQRVFAERGLDDEGCGRAAFLERAGEGVDEFVAAVAEGEAGGGQTVPTGRRVEGLLGVGRGVGRERRRGPEQGGAEECV